MNKKNNDFQDVISLLLKGLKGLGIFIIELIDTFIGAINSINENDKEETFEDVDSGTRDMLRDLYKKIDDLESKIDEIKGGK